MIVGLKGGNAKTQIRAGQRLPIRILDKFVVAQDQVPILAELLFDSTTDSGLKLPAGTRFYGEASFQKGGDRAGIQFRQISLPYGQIRPITALRLERTVNPDPRPCLFGWDEEYRRPAPYDLCWRTGGREYADEYFWPISRRDRKWHA